MFQSSALSDTDTVNENLAEYHAGKGLDEEKLKENLTVNNFDILKFEKTSEMGFRFTDFFARWLNSYIGIKIIAPKQSN